jgi:predicted GNAT family acetyltransferase
MQVTLHTSRTTLLDLAGEALRRTEAEHALLLGILENPSADPASELLVSVEDERGPLGVALRTPPHNLILSLMPLAAVAPLAEHLREHELPGVVGPRELARRFAELHTASTNRTARTLFRQGLYRLTELVPQPARAAGVLRRATADDLPRVGPWAVAFAREAKLPAHEIASIGAQVPRFVAEGGLFVWEHDGEPVAMAALRGATKNGVRISYVYTPPEHRAHGYATAAVAELSASALASGKKFCTLFADRENRTSTGIYERLGYCMLHETEVIAFDPSA